MIFIMNMASGTTQDDEPLLCSSKKAVCSALSESYDRNEHVEPRLATVQSETFIQSSQPLIAGLEIEKLIQTIED